MTCIFVMLSGQHHVKQVKSKTMRVYFDDKDEIKGYSTDVSALSWLVLPIWLLVGVLVALAMPLVFAFLVYYFHKMGKDTQAKIVAVLGTIASVMWLFMLWL